MATHLGTSDVNENRGERFLLAQGLWMVVTLIFLLLTGQLTVELFFVLSFIGLLTLTHVLRPEPSPSGWWRVVDWTIAIGMAVFIFLTTRRVLLLIN